MIWGYHHFRKHPYLHPTHFIWRLHRHLGIPNPHLDEMIIPGLEYVGSVPDSWGCGVSLPNGNSWLKKVEVTANCLLYTWDGPTTKPRIRETLGTKTHRENSPRSFFSGALLFERRPWVWGGIVSPWKSKTI